MFKFRVHFKSNIYFPTRVALTITQLSASKRKPERVNVYIDGEFRVQIHVDLVYKHSLSKGRVVTEELLTLLDTDKQQMKTRALALAYATYKMRTEQQVRKRLRVKGVEDEGIEQAIQFLTEFGYLNDAEYAQMYVKDILLRKAVAAQRLRQDLMKKGVAEQYVTQAIDAHYPHELSEKLAMTAALRKKKSVAYRPADKQFNSVRDYLQRQGFEWSIIRSVMSHVFSVQETEDP